MVETYPDRIEGLDERTLGSGPFRGVPFLTVPELRVVVDHLPGLDPPRDPEGRAAYERVLRELAQRP